MKAATKKPFNRRKFVSMGLFLTLAVLVITAIVIQIFEALEVEFFIQIFTVVHIFNGLAFTVLSVLHILMNWQPMINYIKNKESAISREAVYALLLAMTAILAGVLFVCFLID